MALMSAVFPVYVCAGGDSLAWPVFLCSIVAYACRCFGKQGPSLPPSSSLMRSTLSPAKEEGTVRYAIEGGIKLEEKMYRDNET